MTTPASRLRPALAAASALVLAACAAQPPVRPAAAVDPAAAPGAVTVGIIALNDFHGNLEPPHASVIAPDGHGGQVAVPAGGAAWLASAIDSLRARYRYHLTVAAGDFISASQLASSLYLDEPAIGVGNRIGLEYTAVGNHEFDRGRAELLRMQNGGCAKNTRTTPCALEPFAGAKFRYMAASTLTEDGTPLFPGTALRTFGEGARAVRVGLIGLTLRGTPSLVTPSGVRGLTFADEATTINAATATLKAAGADAIVVLIHQGGAQEPDRDPNSCAGFSGDIRPILDALDPRVDVVVSGHTHRAYICDYAALNPAHPLLLTSAGLYGKLVTDIALAIDPASHRVVSKRAHNVIVQSEGYTGAKGPVPLTSAYPAFTPRADVAAYVARYAAAAHAFTGRIAGHLAEPASGRALGQLIADSQLAATRGAGAQIALMNPGGVRAPLVPGEGQAVTFGALYAVQPFGNALITQSFTGAGLKAVLEQCFDGVGTDEPLLVSDGFAYRYDRRRPVGQRITAMTLNGAAIDPAATYRVTSNAFLAQGGDGFTALTVGQAAQEGVSDVAALEAWLAAPGPHRPPHEPRALADEP